MHPFNRKEAVRHWEQQAHFLSAQEKQCVSELQNALERCGLMHDWCLLEQGWKEQYIKVSRDVKSAHRNPKRASEILGAINQTCSQLESSEATFAACLEDKDKMLFDVTHQPLCIRTVCARNENVKSLPQAVRDCDAFLAEHGPTFSWHEKDHEMFLRCVVEHAGETPDSVVLGCAELIPNVPAAEIHRHLTLYVESIQLLRKKKEAIEEFQQRREADRQNNEAVRNMEEQQRKLEEKLNNLEQEKKRLRRMEETAAQLAVWKARKETNKLEKQKAEKKEARCGEKYFQPHPIVRAAKPKITEVHVDVQPAAKVTRSELERRWFDDQERMRKRRVLIEAANKNRHQEQRQKELECITSVRSPCTSRSFDRLLQPTTSSAARTQSTEEEKIYLTRDREYLTPRSFHQNRTTPSWCGGAHLL